MMNIQRTPYEAVVPEWNLIADAYLAITEMPMSDLKRGRMLAQIRTQEAVFLGRHGWSTPDFIRELLRRASDAVVTPVEPGALESEYN